MRNGHQVREVLEYVQANFHRKLTLSGLARLCEVRSEHFCRAFKDATGQTPGRYIRHLRFECARRLLETNSLTVKEIMARVGLNDPSHFSRYFRREYGVSPSEYRARAKEQRRVEDARI